MDNLIEFLLYLQGPIPYLVGFSVLLACGLGVPIPEDITLFAMALISYYGLIDLKIAAIVCLFGVLTGDCIVYFLGHHYGSRIAKKGIFAKLLHPERMAKTKHNFHKWGNKLIFGARFTPGFRAATFFSAGTLHLPFKTFIFYDGMAAIISVPLLMGIVYHFGDQVDRIIRVVRKLENGMTIIIVAVLLIFILKHFFMKYQQNKK